MKHFIFFCSLVFLIGSSLNAQQSPIPSLDNDALVTDWSEHEANAFKKRGMGQRIPLFLTLIIKIGLVV